MSEIDSGTLVSTTGGSDTLRPVAGVAATAALPGATVDRARIEECAQSDAKKEACGRRGRDPSRRHARLGGCGSPRARLMARERDDARRVDEKLQAPRDVLLLRSHALGRKNVVELGVRLGANPVHEAPEIRVARVTFRAVGEVHGGRRLDRLPALFGHVAVEETVFREMARLEHHGFPPRRARSLRAARNRWTRTVDSLRPVMALTSRGVQSP